MKGYKLNEFIIGFSVTVIDFLYRNRDIQRFWLLETMARAPYFAFLSVLHLKESLGLRGDQHIYLMKQHFEQTVNETEHLEYMESLGGGQYLIDRIFARLLVLIWYWGMVKYYLLFPASAYHINTLIEKHAAHTYSKYLETHVDEKIEAIKQDELDHYDELVKAMKMFE